MTLLQFAIVLLLGAIAVLLGVFIGYQAAQGRLRDLRARNAQLAAQLQLCEEAEVRAEALEALGEASYNALLLLDELHRVVHLNAVARRLFTVEKGSDIAPGSTLLALTRHHEIDDLVTETLESGEDVESQVMFDDQVFRVRSHLVRTDGEPLVGLALQDISELQRLGRARRDMVANVSHELRTPITSLRLLADTLKRDERLAEHSLWLLDKIDDEIDTLEQIAQELLDLATIESGRAEFILKPVPAAEIIERAVQHFTEQARRNGLEIEVQAPPDLIAMADAQQVERVLGNLLHNAIKFTPEGGRITIQVERANDKLQFSVTDTGVGIPHDERSRVFERFYRGDRARRGGGTGLGLAIAKHIVQLHGGTIWAEEPPNPPGARLVFTLPTPEE
ncbi:MAG: ATP-binding protein [Aggregatilineales bacterium]